MTFEANDERTGDRFMIYIDAVTSRDVTSRHVTSSGARFGEINAKATGHRSIARSIDRAIDRSRVR